MKIYDVSKITVDFTNADFARQWFPKAIYEENDSYDLGNRYYIEHLEGERFTVDNIYYQSDVGQVTDTEIFEGNFGECIDFVLKREGIEK